ncbi:uncharacterized protein LOC133194788 [Saccostrea echinata]|uniref:uncharacterized protein LOC133194788 n=1 Tax=Saccostrea echinata TaxID=191078 RepID=UPI002A806C15|nr:uncharacterized protein LOC133194788 [Saccostrea echinata]
MKHISDHDKMDKTRKRIAVLAIVMAFITLNIWFVAMITPGWFIVSWKYIDPLMTHKDSKYMRDLMKFSSDSLKTVTVDVEMSIWYCSICLQDTCVQVSYQELNREALLMKRAEKSKSPFPYLIDIQVWSILAIIFCLCSLTLLVFNFGNACRIRAGGITMFVAALFEIVLLLRMIIANVPVAEAVNMEVKTAYSIILSGIGLVFSFLVTFLCKILYSKYVQQVPPSTSAHFAIIQESD